MRWRTSATNTDTSPVFGHAHRFLQQARGRARALVHGAIEHQQGQRSRQVRTAQRIPVIAAIEFNRVIHRQAPNVEIRISALGNAVFRQPAGVLAVVRQTAFLQQNGAHATIKVFHQRSPSIER